MISLAAIGNSQVFASNTPNFQVQIFPLECSLDSVALGNVNTLQLTPENCIPGSPEPPTVIPPTGRGNSPFFPGSGSTVFLNNPTVQIPSSNFPVSDMRGPLIVDPRNTTDEKTADQIQASTIIISAAILLAAGLLAAAHAVYTGILAPLIAQGNLPKIRFPWSKK